MFSANTSQGHTILYDLTLDALDEEDYCHFETALEFLHNRIHFFIGGSGTYSMSTLDYSAFDPFFMLVHSSMDRIWVLWEVSLFVKTLILESKFMGHYSAFTKRNIMVLSISFSSTCILLEADIGYHGCLNLSLI